MPRARAIARAFTSERIKLLSVRSTVYTLVVAAAALVLLATFAALGADGGTPSEDGAGTGPLGGALAGVPFAELVVAVLGVLAVSGEYASGLVKVTFTAVPARWPVVVAKGLVVASAVFVTTLVAVFAAFAATAVVLSAHDLPVSLTAPGALRALVAGPVYLAGISLLGVALGWLLRSTAGAMAAFFGMLYLLPVVGFVLPADVAPTVIKLLPGNAGSAMMQLAPSELLSPGAGLAVFTGYVALAFAAAAWVVRSRDA